MSFENFILIFVGNAALYGHGHYKTFDGRSFNYPSTCPSTMVASTDNVFSVTTDKKACDNLPCYMVVIVTYKKNRIKLMCTNNEFHTLVNGKKETFPVVSKNGFRIVKTSSTIIKFVATEGMQVTWDGKLRLNVKVPASYMGKMVGLAGNFNFKTIDDFVTSSGDLSHLEVDFGNSWIVPQHNCSKIDADGAELELTPCESNHQNALEAERRCSILMSNVFSQCHATVDTELYYTNCKEDFCGCGKEGKECLCAVFSAYASECASQGKQVYGWRNASGCGKIFNLFPDTVWSSEVLVNIS